MKRKHLLLVIVFCLAPARPALAAAGIDSGAAAWMMASTALVMIMAPAGAGPVLRPSRTACNPGAVHCGHGGVQRRRHPGSGLPDPADNRRSARAVGKRN